MKNIFWGYIEKFKKFLPGFLEFNKKYGITDIFIIVAIMILLFVITKDYYFFLLPDRGREFLFPQEILNGKVPYKDITMIYFPFAYYINAIIYKLMGISINSLMVSQLFLCTVFMCFYYFCARIFIDKKNSLLLSIFAILSCIFANNDLFSYIKPYSYAMAYGIISFFFCVFCLVKLFKTDNLKYLYFAFFLAGFSVSCKLEFLFTYFLLICALFMYKKLKFAEYMKLLALALIIPITLIAVLFAQGVNIQDLIQAIKFGYVFSGTDAMKQYLIYSGMYPSTLILPTIKNFLFLLVTIFSYVIILHPKFKYSKIFVFLAPVLFLYLYKDMHITRFFWTFLPIIILLLTIIKFKELKTNNKALLILLIASILISQRAFFYFDIIGYSTFSFLFLNLSLLAFLEEYVQKPLLGVNIKVVIQHVLILFIILFSFYIHKKQEYASFSVNTNYGIMNVDFKNYCALSTILNYIDQNIDKDKSILVLPEGTIINFLSGRKTDMKCFMMDRLYHDAYGEEKAKDMIAAANSDYIILLKGFKLCDFAYPYLYDSPTATNEYIKNNYTVKDRYNYMGNEITILKKNDIINK